MLDKHSLFIVNGSPHMIVVNQEHEEKLIFLTIRPLSAAGAR